MRLARLGRPEVIALAGAVLLALGLFLPWYETNPSNPNATIDGTRGSLSGWQVQSVLRFALLAVAVAPFVLAWIVVREHELSWPRGEMTAVLAMVALVLTLYVGVVDKPGEPSGEIALRAGWFAAVLGCILECAGGALRAGTTDRPRKPPGVL
jgi:hypothetical protein